nr:carboxymuconolactone decarboxylase family protein [Aureimonas endophytica]
MAQETTSAALPSGSVSTLSSADIQAVSPALARYGKEDIRRLWDRPQLSRRDRSLVTASILIARSQTTDLAHHLNVALDSGVSPGELSEAVTHLAFYAGWPNAMAAVAVAKDVFTARGVDPSELPEASPELRAIDEEAERTRRASVERLLGTASPGLDQFTTDPLFADVWLRPGLTPRDRSLVTITSLMANGQVAQLAGHLDRALDNGLTKEETGEVVTQIAFYAGWPNAFSAGPVVKDVIENRPN